MIAEPLKRIDPVTLDAVARYGSGGQHLSEGRWSLSNSGRRKLPPWGLWGGLDGASSINRVRRAGETEFRDEDPATQELRAQQLKARTTNG